MARTERVDIVNEPAVIAAEMAFQQLEAALGRFPNTAGEVSGPAQKGRISIDAIRRIGKGG
jgi:hypothetical protein